MREAVDIECKERGEEGDGELRVVRNLWLACAYSSLAWDGGLAKMMVTTVNTMIVLPCFVVSSEAWRADIASLRFACFWRRSRRWLIFESISTASTT